MKLRRYRLDNMEINLTPLIDVVFLLLIFFMVSTTFDRESELAIELPRSSADAKPSDESQLTVSIDAQGRFFVNGIKLINTRVDTLKRALGDAIGANKKAPVIIHADATTQYQAVVQVMDAARQLGLLKLRFPTSAAAPN